MVTSVYCLTGVEVITCCFSQATMNILSADLDKVTFQEKGRRETGHLMEVILSALLLLHASCSAFVFSSPEHEVLRVSYCDHSLSVSVRRPSVCLSVVPSHFLVYTVASINISQSAPNLVTMYMSIRSQMRLIMSQVITD